MTKGVKPSYGITYLVMRDGGTGRWNVTRDGQPTGGFARDKETAIGVAFRDASREAHGAATSVIVWSVSQEGKRTKEWASS